MAQTRKQKVLQEVKRQRKQRTIISLVIAAVLISIIGGGVYALSRNAGNGSNFPFPCLAENTTLHIHPWLRIIIQTNPGQNYSITIPTAVGILDPQISNGLAGGGSCFEPLHTHDSTGVIHIESAHVTDIYTIGDFFDVWKATPGDATIPGADTAGLGALPVIFNSTDILGFRPDQTHTLSLLVDQGQSTYQNYTGTVSQPTVRSLELNNLDYCSVALSSGLPCSLTASGDPYYAGGSYPYGTGHTIIIYYKAI